jgi:hypothetical protein
VLTGLFDAGKVGAEAPRTASPRRSTTPWPVQVMRSAALTVAVTPVGVTAVTTTV